MSIQQKEVAPPIWTWRRDEIDGARLEIFCNGQRVFFIALDEPQIMSVQEAYALAESVVQVMQDRGMPQPAVPVDLEITRFPRGEL